MSGYEEAILEFIKKNEPTSRKEIIKNFPTITAKTVYLNVSKLLETERIFESKLKTLSTSSNLPVWIIPPILQSGINYSRVANAFARNSPELTLLANELDKDEQTKFMVILMDFIVIYNQLRNPDKLELTRLFKHTKSVDVHELNLRFKQIHEMLKLFSYNGNEEQTVENGNS